MNRGAYSLIIRLRRSSRIRVGKLGVFTFPDGYYVYTGSAMSNLDTRVARHLRPKKKRRWHIDYLLGCESAEVVEVRKYPGELRRECEINRMVKQERGARIIVDCFGASDCQSGCDSHLVYFSSWPKLPEHP